MFFTLFLVLLVLWVLAVANLGGGLLYLAVATAVVVFLFRITMAPTPRGELFDRYRSSVSRR